MNVQNFVKNFNYHMYPGFDGKISECLLKTVKMKRLFSNSKISFITYFGVFLNIINQYLMINGGYTYFFKSVFKYLKI